MEKWSINTLVKADCSFFVFFLVVGVMIFSCMGVYAAEGKNTGGIHIINPDGRGLVQLTSGKEQYPQWSPDGKRIAYRVSRAIYVMNADGSGKVKLVDSGSSPIWSMDGKQIVYSRIQYPKYEIYVVNADGKNQIRLSADGAYPALSPDGKKIAYCGKRRGIFVVNADGTNEVALTNDYGTAPSWSPDGKKIAYHRLFPDSPGECEVKVMNADGSGSRRIADYGEHPAWSRDGKRIAFLVGNSNGVNVINADGTNLIRLSREQGYSYRDLAWSPDGKRVAYHRYKHPDTNEIYVINADGSNKVLLTDSGHNPSWSPNGKRIAFARASD